jgi:hypothetical protein
MIKEGNDHFEVTKHEPKVDFCEKKYVFDAARAPNATRDPVFDASAKCPTYMIPPEIADAAREKQQADDAEVAKLVAKGTPVARMNTGIDGGMNKVFAAALPNGDTGLSEGGTGISLVHQRLPGTIPIDHVNPPHPPTLSQPEAPAVSVAATVPAATTAKVASAAPNGESDGFFSSLARKVGLSNAAADTTASAAPPPAAPAKPKVIEAKRAAPAHPEAKKPEIQQAAAHPPLKPSVTDNTAAAAAPATQGSMVAGAQPIVPANSFDSRFSAAR